MASSGGADGKNEGERQNTIYFERRREEGEKGKKGHVSPPSNAVRRTIRLID
jgi:hypothetical protein